MKLSIKRQVIAYLIFGLFTTLVNIVAYRVLSIFLDYMIANAAAWFLSVVFAYFTNRRYVFKSSTKGRTIIKEALAFLGARAFSGILDMAIMYCGVGLLGIADSITKIAANVVVIVLNYILGKLIVFSGKTMGRQ